MLAWLLGEPGSDSVRTALAHADHVITSDLTIVECDRALVRAETLLDLSDTEIGKRRALLERTAAHWALLSIDASVIARARRPFPAEPIRMLDALHLASALRAAESLQDLTVLSLDRRVRSSAQALGLRVLPAA